MLLLSLTCAYGFAGNDEMKRAYRQSVTEEAAAVLAEQQAAGLAVEMADARAAAVAEQCAQVRRQEITQRRPPKVLATKYSILNDANPAAAARGSAAAAAAIVVAAAQPSVSGRGQQQLSRLEIQAKDQLDAVLRQTLQRQRRQQQPRAPAVPAKKTEKTRVSRSQSASDEVKQIVHLLAGGKHGTSILLPARSLTVRTIPA